MNSWLKKYWTAFKLHTSFQLIYRANLFFGLVRQLVIFGGTFYLMDSFKSGLGNYDPSELLTYVLASTLLSEMIFSFGPASMQRMADEIADGDLINYLLRPVNYFGVWSSRAASKKFVHLFFGIFEVALFLIIFRNREFFWQSNIGPILASLVLLIGALIIGQLIIFIGSVLAFWTVRSNGPRWLILMMTLFFSGSLIPLDLFPEWLRKIFFATPFPSMIFAPIKGYLGDLKGGQLYSTLLVQLAWIAVLTILLTILWRKGVKSYESYGR